MYGMPAHRVQHHGGNPEQHPHPHHPHPHGAPIEKPVKAAPKKKPATRRNPEKRKEQNRAAQRAFRDRKERVSLPSLAICLAFVSASLTTLVPSVAFD